MENLDYVKFLEELETRAEDDLCNFLGMEKNVSIKY